MADNFLTSTQPITPPPQPTDNFLTSTQPVQPVIDPVELQRGLAALGYYTGPIDGIIGPLTKEAIKKWEAAGSPPFPAAAKAPSTSVETPGDKYSLPVTSATPAAVTTTAAGSSAPSEPPEARVTMTPEQEDAWIKENYPDLAHYLDHPELGSILREAAEGGWDIHKLWGKIRGTEWWNTTAVSVRNFEFEKATDTMAVVGKIEKVQEQMVKLARQMGVTIPNMQTLYDLAEKAVKFDWSPDEAQGAIANFLQYSPDKLRGTAGDIQDQVRKVSQAYIIPMSPQTEEHWVKAILSGRVTLADFGQYAQEQAQSLFPHLKDAYSKGMTTAQYVAPYAEIAGRELGLDPNQIDWFDPKWQKALSQVDPETGERGAMSLADWMTEIRTNENYGWSKTVGAKELGTEFATALGQRWGRVA